MISDDSDSDSECKPDVIVISDDSDSALESLNAYKMADSKKHAIKPEHLEDHQPAKQHALNPEVIEIPDSSSDEGKMTQVIKAELCDMTAKSDLKSGLTPINIQNSLAGSPSHAHSWEDYCDMKGEGWCCWASQRDSQLLASS